MTKTSSPRNLRSLHDLHASNIPENAIIHELQRGAEIGLPKRKELGYLIYTFDRVRTARKREIFKSEIVGGEGIGAGLITTARNYLASYRERRERTGRRNELMIKDKYQSTGEKDRRNEAQRTKKRNERGRRERRTKGKKASSSRSKGSRRFLPSATPPPSLFLSLSLFPLFFSFVSFHPPISTRHRPKARRRTKISRIYTR